MSTGGWNSKEYKECQKMKNRRIQLVHWPGLGPAAISGQSKTATNTISDSNPCLQARRNWQRRAPVSLTSANTSSARGWTFPWRFLINLDVHRGSPYRSE